MFRIALDMVMESVECKTKNIIYIRSAWFFLYVICVGWHALSLSFVLTMPAILFKFNFPSLALFFVRLFVRPFSVALSISTSLFCFALAITTVSLLLIYNYCRSLEFDQWNVYNMCLYVLCIVFNRKNIQLCSKSDGK